MRKETTVRKEEFDRITVAVNIYLSKMVGANKSGLKMLENKKFLIELLDNNFSKEVTEILKLISYEDGKGTFRVGKIGIIISNNRGLIRLER
jgi:hypothetical protein